MPVIKKITGRFTAISDDVIEILSFPALGFLTKMVQLPPDWEFTRGQLEQQFNIGRYTLTRITKELKDARVLIIRAVRDEESRKFDGWEWLVSPFQMTDEMTVVNQGVDLQTTGKNRASINRVETLSLNLNLIPNSSKSIQEEEEFKSKSKRNTNRATRLSEDFKPDASMLTWAKDKTPNVDPEIETELFINYWLSKPGKIAEKLDWRRTWMNWMLTSQRRCVPQHVAIRKQKLAEIDDLIKRLDEEDD